MKYCNKHVTILGHQTDPEVTNSWWTIKKYIYSRTVSTISFVSRKLVVLSQNLLFQIVLNFFLFTSLIFSDILWMINYNLRAPIYLIKWTIPDNYAIILRDQQWIIIMGMTYCDYKFHDAFQMIYIFNFYWVKCQHGREGELYDWNEFILNPPYFLKIVIKLFFLSNFNHSRWNYFRSNAIVLIYVFLNVKKRLLNSTLILFSYVWSRITSHVVQTISNQGLFKFVWNR